MNKYGYIKRIILILLIPLSGLAFYSAPKIPHFIENTFSRGLFKVFAQALSRLTAVLPFSLAEIGLLLIPAAVLAFIIYHIVMLIKHKGKRLAVILRFVLNTGAVIGVVYFIFVFFWALNYSRLSFAEIAHLDVSPSSTAELSQVCEKLIVRSNELSKVVHRSPQGVMTLENKYRETFKLAQKGFDSAAEEYSVLKGKYGAPKPVLLSRPMSYTGLAGIYCPFTAEAHVNVDMPDVLIPSTATHEMAHQRGFAREDEANYIAYLTCAAHPDANFQYSGNMLALIHSMNALYRSDNKEFNRLHALYSPELIADLTANNEYWKSFEGPVEKAADSLNNNYLKANLQKEGVKSYGRMVDLLIAQNRAGKMP